jgi:hypothetical protein
MDATRWQAGMDAAAAGGVAAAGVAAAPGTAAAHGEAAPAAGEAAAAARVLAGSTVAAGEAEPAAFMKAVATPEAAAFIAERGGRLYVWADTFHCCGGTPVRIVRSTTSAPRGVSGFRRFQAAGFEILVHRSAGPPPAEIEVRLRGRWRPRICAYWEQMPV